ncbi:MAG: stage II sporulation protein E [Desulfobacteraceae bacterium 4572_35.1]|nr:MAG: stage II sporulation protein E [Desulfobacteraceae bacterium 4572_35.1]
MTYEHINLTILFYVLILFAVAFGAASHRKHGKSIVSNPHIYSLTLAIYCTSWTYYGSVGRAATTGLDFLTIYLGPTLISFTWWFLLRKIILISKEHNIVSIADFIASRYGKSTYLGVIVTIFAVLGIVPYIALQLKAINHTFNLIGNWPDASVNAATFIKFGGVDTAFIVAVFLALFCILFAAMRLDSTEHHEGLIAVIALESIIKLIAFLAIGIFVTYGLFDGFSDIFTKFTNTFPDKQNLLRLSPTCSSGPRWFSMTFMSMMAVMFLPRQFHAMVIENTNHNHVRTAMWAFPAYLFLINLFVLPIAVGGLLTFNGDTSLADYYVLSLPLSANQQALAVLVFIGGFSAAAGMVMLESITSATMILNNLVMPIILRFNLKMTDMSGILLNIKRLAIIGVIFLGYFYYHILGESAALINIGLISFMAATQFAPALLAGLYWEKANQRGAAIGLILGFILWCYTLLIPSFVNAGWLPTGILTEGPFAIAWLKPTALFYLDNLDIWSHSLFWTLFFNIGAFLTISITTKQSKQEQEQAHRFVQVSTWDKNKNQLSRLSKAPSIMEFVDLMSKFIGEKEAHTAIAEYLGDRTVDEKGSLSEYEIPNLKRFTEKTLAASVGAASARIIIENYLSARGSKMEDIFNIFGTVSLSRNASREQLSVLYEAANAVSSGADLDDIFDSILELLYRQFRFDLCVLRFYDEQENKLIVRNFKGIDTDFLSRADREINDETCIGKAYINNKIQLANDSDCVDNPVSVAIVQREGIKSFAHAPVTIEGQPIGVLSSYSHYSKGIYTDEFIELYKNLAAQIGIAWRNANQIAKLIEASEQEKELRIAESIQLGLLPDKMPDISGLDIAGICIPAKQVGGDYYDFIVQSPDIDIVIADVSGHNVGAALLMAEARTFIQARARLLVSPTVVVDSLNRFLYKDLTKAELFITLFYLKYDHDKKLMTYTNAGHNHPLVYHSSTKSFEELDTEGLILGIKQEVSFEERHGILETGDILIMYTDGIIEATNNKGELFGLERLKNAIIESIDNDSQTIIDNTLIIARMFQGQRHFVDDVTMIVVKINQ